MTEYVIYLTTTKYDSVTFSASYQGLYGGEVVLHGESKITLDILCGLKARKAEFGISHCGNWTGHLIVRSIDTEPDGTWRALLGAKS